MPPEVGIAATSFSPMLVLALICMLLLDFILVLDDVLDYGLVVSSQCLEISHEASSRHCLLICRVLLGLEASYDLQMFKPIHTRCCFRVYIRRLIYASLAAEIADKGITSL